MKQIHNNEKPIHEVSAVEANTGIASMPVQDEITEGKETSTVNLGGMVNHKRQPLKRPTFSNGGSSDDGKPAAKKRKVVAENFNKSENQSAAQNFQGRPKEMRSVVRNLRLTNFELLSEQELRTLGRTVYQLSNEQVLTPNYGAHTLRLLDYLPFDFNPKNIQFTAKLLMDKKNKWGTMEKSFNQERFKMVSGLNKFQAHGIIEYGLSRAQVIHRDFSARIMDVMEKLRLADPAAAGPYLYDTAIHLPEHQIRGIVLHQLALSQVGIAKVNGRFEQVTPLVFNFGEDLVLSTQFRRDHEMYEMGLNIKESRLISNYLSYEDMRTPNFGQHTLNAIINLLEDLDREPGAESVQEAFQLVSGLQEYQTIGIADYSLTRAQVMNPEFNNSILKVIKVLSPYHVVTDEVGYVYNMAMNLSNDQIRGISLYNLTLSQVQHPIFTNDQEILEKLMKQLLKELGVEEAELQIPLDQKGQEMIRTIFDSMIPIKAINQGTENTQTAIQNTENEIRSGLAEMAGVASIPFLDAEDQFIAQNSPEQHQETGGDLERGRQESQESTALQSSNPQRGSGVVESFENLMHSPASSIPSNVVRRGDPDLNNTKPNKNHKLKTKQNRP